MKKFQFTLQTLHNVKSSEESNERNRLAGLIRERDGVAAQIADLERRYARHNEAYQKDCKRGISGSKLKEYGAYFEFMAAEKKRLMTLLKLCESRISECQKALLKLINEIKVLNRMREEQMQEYLKEVRIDEDKALEDFISGHRE